MPVTAKLSRKFYERLGDDITTELVDWFNSVDAEYQGQLRETNEMNWQRFRAELHSEVGQSEARLRVELSELRSEIAKSEGRLRVELSEVRSEIAKSEGRLRVEIAGVRGELSGVKTDMLKWMFVFWTGTLIPLAGLMIALR